MVRLFAAFGIACTATCVCAAVGGAACAASLDVLSSFSGGADGATPLGSLVGDGKGHFFGATSAGANGSGTVFEVSPGHKLKTLYAFCSQQNCVDGSSPHAEPVFDASGNLYGTTAGGGVNGDGTVFELGSNGSEKVLYSFCSNFVNGSCADGSVPVAALATDSSGNFFGTTQLGGMNNHGAVFELSFDAKKGTWKEKILYSFCPQGGCADGETPLAGVALDTSGIYGTTQLGGTNAQGTVFKVVVRHAAESVLYSFCSAAGCADGAEPNAGVTIDKTGILYGTTKYGGNPACGDGGGVVFRLGRTGKESVLYAFCQAMGDADGSYPEAGVIADKKGELYGTTAAGGVSGRGVAFGILGGGERLDYSFCSPTKCPAAPVAALLEDNAGDFFGTTSGGGKHGLGTVFELKP